MLNFVVEINGEVFGAVEIIRTSPFVPFADTVCTYQWKLSDRNQTRMGHGLKHVHGEGPWSLIAKVAAAAAVRPGSATDDDHPLADNRPPLRGRDRPTDM